LASEKWFAKNKLLARTSNFTKMDSSTYYHTHTHTPQHSIHVNCVAQSRCPHSKSNPKTAQTKKTNKTKATSVVYNFMPTHPHIEQKTNCTWLD
jgi:GTP cyclohydrolase FolE2